MYRLLINVLIQCHLNVIKCFILMPINALANGLGVPPGYFSSQNNRPAHTYGTDATRFDMQGPIVKTVTIPRWIEAIFKSLWSKCDIHGHLHWRSSKKGVVVLNPSVKHEGAEVCFCPYY